MSAEDKYLPGNNSIELVFEATGESRNIYIEKRQTVLKTKGSKPFTLWYSPCRHFDNSFVLLNAFFFRLLFLELEHDFFLALKGKTLGKAEVCRVHSTHKQIHTQVISYKNRSTLMWALLRVDLLIMRLVWIYCSFDSHYDDAYVSYLRHRHNNCFLWKHTQQMINFNCLYFLM